MRCRSRSSRAVLPAAFPARSSRSPPSTAARQSRSAPTWPSSPMASHVGHVSGGCVEPAIAAEVVADHARGQGPRSPLRQGLALSRHPLPLRRRRRSPDPRRARSRPSRRGARAHRSAARPSPSASTRSTPAPPSSIDTEMGWHDGVFVRRYLPRTKLLLVGRGPDFEVLARVAAAAEMDLSLATPDENSALALADLNAPVELLKTPGQPWDLADRSLDRDRPPLPRARVGERDPRPRRRCKRLLRRRPRQREDPPRALRTPRRDGRSGRADRPHPRPHRPHRPRPRSRHAGAFGARRNLSRPHRA